MIGFIDGGGGMRGVYTAGIYDYLLDAGISIDYGIGVSAGAANMITFLAGQRGRTLTFFADYTFRKEYMGLGNWLKHGNFLNLDYIYTTLTVRGGEYPLDFASVCKNCTPFYIAATNAYTGLQHYFTIADMAQDQYDVLKASCAIPVACKPYPVAGSLWFDGGVSTPIPFQKALDDGCEKIVVLLTRPLDYVKEKQSNLWLLSRFLKKYPAIMQLLEHRHEVYNNAMQQLKELERQGKALLVTPDDPCGVAALKKNREAFLQLYQKGYEDGAKIKQFLQSNS